MADKPSHALDYASSTTPRTPFRLRSWHVAIVTGAFAILAAVFIPPTVGSGVASVNPFAALSCFAIIAGAIIYVWMRLFEEADPLQGVSVFVGVCSTIAIIALPFQFWTLAHSYGEPNPWLRVKLFSPTLLRPNLYWPGVIVIAALVLAAIGRGITQHCTGPARRNGPRDTKAGRCRAGQ